MILAVARGGVIGRDGRLPWNLPAEWRHFLDTTRGGILIHGRKCQDHLGPPLPGRDVIVLSRNPSYTIRGASVAQSMSDALKIADKLPNPGPIWIGGGLAIYLEALPLADKIYLTGIDADFDGDTRLPPDAFKNAGFTRVLEEVPGESAPVKYTFKVLAR